MRNRNYYNATVERIQNRLPVITMLLGQGQDPRLIKAELELINNYCEDLKTQIEREPFTNDENKL
jgi:archaellum component FlaC